LAGFVVPAVAGMRWIVNLLLVFVLPSLLSFSCDDLPRDQTGAMDRIRQTHEIRVGLVENPPFVIRDGGEPRGVEVEAIKKFAESVNARPVWNWGGEERLMPALEHFEMDIVAGGVHATTAWNKRVGLTAPYVQEQVLAIPPGENELLRRLDAFMHSHKDEIETMLAEETAK
jgi:membrane-bound lytic murein transglycosylase MltF